jgi:hypothetical protein
MKRPSKVNGPPRNEPEQLKLADVEKVSRGGKRAVSGISMKLGPRILGLLGPKAPASLP